MKRRLNDSTKIGKVRRSRPEQALNWLADLGVIMFGFSMILMFAGVSGATLHNILTVGGLALAVVGGLGSWIASKFR